MNYLKNRKNAFIYAFSGLWQAFKQEVHLKLFVFIAVLVISLGFYLKITKSDWYVVIACIAAVLSSELVNSAVEKLCDLLMPDQHPKIKYIKDVMAGAVLLICICAAIAGLMVFIPYLGS